MSIDDLKEMIREDVSGEEREIAVLVAADLAFLTSAKTAGSDVSDELAHLEAQTMNLSSAAKSKIRNALIEWTGEITRGVLMAALG